MKDSPLPRRDSSWARHREKLRLGVAAALLAPVLALSPRLAVPADHPLNPRLLGLPANRWVQVFEPGPIAWVREAHAGLAYNSKRGTLLIFGSDVHGALVTRELDNEIHEFSPSTGLWTTFYRRAPMSSYRADQWGNAVCGIGDPMPWAMHTYDNLVYDARWDALWVTATPGSTFHNPMINEVPGVKRFPQWVYDLRRWKWIIFPNRGKPWPPLFGGGAAYDTRRDTIVAYDATGVWEIGPARDEWKQATPESHHTKHFNMEYSERSGKFFVFGGQLQEPEGALASDVWVYTPGSAPGEKGTWERKTPRGDPCPPGHYYPVACHPEKDLFLLVPNDRVTGRNVTMVYDPVADRLTTLAGADGERLGMNYMMAYDALHGVFLLVRGGYQRPPVVAAFRLVW